jgi:hypothetical protein
MHVWAAPLARAMFCNEFRIRRDWYNLRTALTIRMAAVNVTMWPAGNAQLRCGIFIACAAWPDRSYDAAEMLGVLSSPAPGHPVMPPSRSLR